MEQPEAYSKTSFDLFYYINGCVIECMKKYTDAFN